jgi:hypothetical protein
MLKQPALWISILMLIGPIQAQNASVGGHITSTGGAVLSTVDVLLLQPKYDEGGRRRNVIAYSVKADAGGDFNIPGVAPGRYYVAAGSAFTPMISYWQDQLERGNLPGSPPPRNTLIYYPAAGGLTAVSAIDVAPGVDIVGIDFAVPQSRTFQIRGSVIDEETGVPPPSGARLTFLLWPREDPPFDPNGLMAAEMRMSRRPYAGDGTFLHADVPPGDYWVMARLRKAVNPAAELPATTSVARVPVRVTDSDVINVQMRLPRLVTVNAQLRVDEESRVDLTGIQVQLAPPKNSWGHMLGAEVWPPTPGIADGTFQFENVALGEYQLFVTGMPPNAYVKDVRFGSTNVLGQSIVVSGPSADLLAITISGKAGRVEGIVTDQGRPVPNARVVLVPDRLRDRSELYVAGSTNTSGQFTLDNIAPGDYKAFAWRVLEPHAYFDPELQRQAETKAVGIRVNESSNHKIEIQVSDIR